MSTTAARNRKLLSRETFITSSAREIIRNDGLLNLQITKIAQNCKCAIGTIYRHFTSKEDLLLAIVIENSFQRMELFRKIPFWKIPTRDRMFGMAIAYMLYSEHFPEHIQIEQYVQSEMVWSAASKERRQIALASSAPLLKIASAIVGEAVKNGELEAQNLHHMEITLPILALITGERGISHLQVHSTQIDLLNSNRLMLRHLQTFLNGLNWNPLADLSDVALLDAKMSILQNKLFQDYSFVPPSSSPILKTMLKIKSVQEA